MAHHGQKAVLSSTLAGGLNRISVVDGPLVPFFRRQLLSILKKFRRRLRQPTSDRHLAFWLDQWANRTSRRLDAPTQAAIASVINSCDLWLLPYVGLDQQFTKPTVVAIHDLVCYHFPEMMRPVKLAAFKALVNRVSGQATLAVCMSEFIRDNDLLGTLNLPADRVRVLTSSVPDDLGLEVAARNQRPRALPESISGPYLFYPAGFRSYKNHRLLIEALHQLKQRSSTSWKLVFTGIASCPRELKHTIKQLGLTDDVAILRKVSRVELTEIYQNAFATIVPSLYEQGSFPALEALHCKCPVAVSDILSLRQQLKTMGDSMLYFDPHSAEALVSTIEKIERDRDSIIESQSLGFLSLQTHTWEKSAKGWLQVFREALLLGNRIEDHARSVNAA